MNLFKFIVRQQLFSFPARKDFALSAGAVYYSIENYPNEISTYRILKSDLLKIRMYFYEVLFSIALSIFFISVVNSTFLVIFYSLVLLEAISKLVDLTRIGLASVNLLRYYKTSDGKSCLKLANKFYYYKFFNDTDAEQVILRSELANEV